MIRKCLAFALVGLVFYGVNLQIISAQSETNNALEKIKTDVYRRGTGEKSKVVVEMKNGTKLKGYISQTLEDSFDLKNAKTKQFTTVLYSDVAQVKRQGLSKGAKIAIGVGIAAAIVTAVVIGIAAKNPLGGFCPLGCGTF